MNDLNIVNINESVPFPIDWNMFPASIPNGMNNMKKHNILRHCVMLEARTALSAEYENMNDKGSAHMKKNEDTIIDEINPNLIP